MGCTASMSQTPRALSAIGPEESSVSHAVWPPPSAPTTVTRPKKEATNTNPTATTAATATAAAAAAQQRHDAMEAASITIGGITMRHAQYWDRDDIESRSYRTWKVLLLGTRDSGKSTIMKALLHYPLCDRPHRWQLPLVRNEMCMSISCMVMIAMKTLVMCAAQPFDFAIEVQHTKSRCIPSTCRVCRRRAPPQPTNNTPPPPVPPATTATVSTTGTSLLSSVNRSLSEATRLREDAKRYAFTDMNAIQPWLDALESCNYDDKDDHWWDEPLSDEAHIFVTNYYWRHDHDAQRYITLICDMVHCDTPIALIICYYMEMPIYELAYVMHHIWRTPAIQAVWNERSSLQIDHNAAYYFDRLLYIGQRYAPSSQLLPSLIGGAVRSSIGTSSSLYAAAPAYRVLPVRDRDNGRTRTISAPVLYVPDMDQIMRTHMTTTGFHVHYIDIPSRHDAPLSSLPLSLPTSGKSNATIIPVTSNVSSPITIASTSVGNSNSVPLHSAPLLPSPSPSPLPLPGGGGMTVENKSYRDHNNQRCAMKIYDVPGIRHTRGNWIHAFEAVDAPVICIPLSEFDQMLYEDEKTNRMLESLKLWEELCNSRWFNHSLVVALFTHSDVLRDKLSVYGAYRTAMCIRRLFPDYPLPPTAHAHAHGSNGDDDDGETKENDTYTQRNHSTACKGKNGYDEETKTRAASSVIINTCDTPNNHNRINGGNEHDHGNGSGNGGMATDDFGATIGTYDHVVDFLVNQFTSRYRSPTTVGHTNNDKLITTSPLTNNSNGNSNGVGHIASTPMGTVNDNGNGNAGSSSVTTATAAATVIPSRDLRVFVVNATSVQQITQTFQDIMMELVARHRPTMTMTMATSAPIASASMLPLSPVS